LGQEQRMPMRMMHRWLRMTRVITRWMVIGIYCQVTRCLVLSLVPWLVVSLWLLNLPSRELHVGVPHPLLVKLPLGPEQHLKADSQLALCVVCMFS